MSLTYLPTYLSLLLIYIYLVLLSQKGPIVPTTPKSMTAPQSGPPQGCCESTHPFKIDDSFTLLALFRNLPISTTTNMDDSSTFCALFCQFESYLSQNLRQLLVIGTFSSDDFIKLMQNAKLSSISSIS